MRFVINVWEGKHGTVVYILIQYLPFKSQSTRLKIAEFYV